MLGNKVFAPASPIFSSHTDILFLKYILTCRLCWAGKTTQDSQHNCWLLITGVVKLHLRNTVPSPSSQWSEINSAKEWKGNSIYIKTTSCQPGLYIEMVAYSRYKLVSFSSSDSSFSVCRKGQLFSKGWGARIQADNPVSRAEPHQPAPIPPPPARDQSRPAGQSGSTKTLDHQMSPWQQGRSEVKFKKSIHSSGSVKISSIKHSPRMAGQGLGGKTDPILFQDMSLQIMIQDMAVAEPKTSLPGKQLKQLLKVQGSD